MGRINRQIVIGGAVAGVAALVALAAGAAEAPPVDARVLPARQVVDQVRMAVWKVDWGGPQDSQRLRINYTLDDTRPVAALRGAWAIDRVSVSRLDGTPIDAAPALGNDQIHLSNLNWRDEQVVLTARAYDRKAPKDELGLFDAALRFEDIPLPRGPQPLAVGTKLKTAMGSTVTLAKVGWWQQEGRTPQLALVFAADPPIARLDTQVSLLAARDAVVDDRDWHLEVDRLVAGDLLAEAEATQAAAVTTLLCRRAPTSTATSVTAAVTLRQYLADREVADHFRTFSFRIALPTR